MRTRVFLVSILVLAPSLVSAAAFGFPRQPLWVSSTTAREGEKVTMYAAVYNASDSEMKGAVAFLADGTTFDTKEVSLPAGGSSLITSSWPAVKGTHALSASFVSGTQKESTEKISVTISAALPPPPKEPGVVDKTMSTVSSTISDMTSSVPIVGTVADAIIEQTEKAREAGANFVEPYAKQKVETRPPMNSAVAPSLTDSAQEYGAKGLQLAAAAALFAFDTRWLFYVLAIVLLYLVFRTLKNWVNRPRF